MSYKVILKPGAAEDTETAYDWYEKTREGLGDDFLNELEFYYKKLESNPYAFGRASEDLRKVVLKRFPYVIVFEIENKAVVVYAVLHKHRDTLIRRKRRNQ
jgi:plasmid stabilization system protein ParE